MENSSRRSTPKLSLVLVLLAAFIVPVVFAGWTFFTVAVNTGVIR